MKFSFILAIGMLMVNGCSFVGVEMRPVHDRIIVQAYRPTVYGYAFPDELGDTVGVCKCTRGDTLFAYSVRVNKGTGAAFYLILSGSDTVFIRNGDAETPDDILYGSTSSKFTLPKTQDPTAWARAVVYINNNSTMKIQTSADNLIQTYNPLREGFNEDEAAAIRMRSRTFFAHSLYDETRMRRFAVLVVEDLHSGAFTKREIVDTIKSEIVPHLIHEVMNLGPVLPKPKAAIAEGY